MPALPRALDAARKGGNMSGGNITWRVTVTEGGKTGGLVVTRLFIGCEEPALELQRRLNRARYIVNVCATREPIPERSPEEKARADALLEIAFGNRQGEQEHDGSIH